MSKDFIVIEKSTLYKMGAAIAVLILLLIGAIYEGMEAGDEANLLYDKLEVQKQKATYWHNSYDDLHTSGTCLSRLP